MERALKDAADGDAAEVIGIVEIRDQNLQRALGIARRFRDRIHDRLEQRLQIHSRLSRIHRSGAIFGDGVQDRKVQLRFVCVEVDKQVINLVQHFLRARVGAIDLVDDHDGRQFGLERFREHIAGLRQRALGGIDEQHDAVNHFERALNLATKIGVAGGVDDVDFSKAEINRCVFGENRDAALALQLV